jgi:heme-degrading monooxygenase HmoA
MKTNSIHLVLGVMLILSTEIYSQSTNSKQEAKMETTKTVNEQTYSEHVLIDKFIVHQNAKQEFVERMNINRNFIKNLPGFVEDKVYERVDEQGNLVVVTVAVWENEEAIKKAKEVVQAEYKNQNFNMQEMLKRLGITIDRGIYARVEN